MFGRLQDGHPSLDEETVEQMEVAEQEDRRRIAVEVSLYTAEESLTYLWRGRVRPLVLRVIGHGRW